MAALGFIVASVLIGFAWLSPFHTYPWVTFSSELASFAAGLALWFVCLNQNLKIARAQLFLLPVISIPILQWIFGLISDFSVALLSSSYLFMFWLMIVLAYQLAIGSTHREKIMAYFSCLLLVVAGLSSLIAIIQWLNLESHVYGIMQLKGNRPYANFGQPNNLATFLIMGLLGALYLYEKRKAAVWILLPSSLVILFSICLTQSRTSWIVCFFILIYWAIKQYRKSVRFNLIQLLVWCGAYFIIAGYILPLLTQALISDLGTGVAQTSSIADRASGGHERLGMWVQILHAIAERPWGGYGWNQTSIAVVESIHFNTVQVWFNSAHNVVLDLLVWNGVPLAIFILGYLSIWLFWLNKNAKDTTSIVAILMVSAILIHAMLEFPQRYAYFLLPMGFLLGLIQAQTPQLKGIELNKNVVRSAWVIVVMVLLLICRDYKLFQDNSRFAFKGQALKAEVLGSSQILLLTQFQQRLDWISLKPTTQMTDVELAELAEMVKNKATPYNLKKYAQVLAYNQKPIEAEQQLFVLNQLYKKKMSLVEIVELNQRVK
ncbi:MAG: Wzy polymerase domain-containing protein [Acinetobacter sp.]